MDAPDGALPFYDAEGENHVTAGPGTTWDRRSYTPAPGPGSAPWIPARDWGCSTGTVPWFALDSDLGLFAGGGIGVTHYGFRKDPFSARHTLRAGRAFGPGRARFEYEGLLHHGNSDATTRLRAAWSEIEAFGYYGFGNGTRVAADDDSNDVHQRRIDLSIGFRIPFARRFELEITPVLRHVETRPGRRLIDAERPYGSGRFGEAGLSARLGATAGLAPDGGAPVGAENAERSAAPAAQRDFSIEGSTALFPAIWTGTSETARCVRTST